MSWKNLLFLILFSTANTVFAAGEEFIPLDSIRLPGDDLLFEGRVLTPEEAWNLSKNETALDLSTLNPIDSEILTVDLARREGSARDTLALSKDDIVEFEGVIASNSGVLRFNVLPTTGDQSHYYTVLMEKTLHTTLLRKNILRMLGYRIPAMKWLPSLRVRFKDLEEKRNFMKRQIPDSTYGAATRWVSEAQADDKNEELTITFKDIAVLKSSEEDHYNVAMGVPPSRLGSRALRSLIIPYAWLDLGESVNKFSYVVGQEDNRMIRLPHFASGADFSATMDDALWMLKRLQTISEADVQLAVKEAQFPPEVGALVFEKLKARRNALYKVFKQNAAEWSFDPKKEILPHLKKGRLEKQDWVGYASRFAHGVADSPFQDFQYFLLSKIQAATMENLVDLANKELSVFDVNKARTDFHKDQFETGLNHFVETGEFMDFGVGTWFSPTLNGTLIASRDIVIGNYLGTDNIVQLADTFGVAVSVGGHLGIENLSYGASGAVRAGVQVLKTYTHLKPVKTLKQTFKEPYQNIFVPLVKMGLEKRMAKIVAFEGISAEMQEEERKKEMAELMSHLNKKLGVGESLIITEKLTPNALVMGRYSVMQTRFTLSAGADIALVRRLHLYRKDAETLHVYDDEGNARNFNLSASVDHYLPIVRLSMGNTKGSYKMNLHEVNINSDLEKNPEFYQNATALLQVLDKSSTELLSAKKKPWGVTNHFQDNDTKFAFLVWRSKHLRGNSLYSIDAPEGDGGHYMGLSDETQSGLNYEAFVKDIGNYFLDKYYSEIGLAISVERFKNPAQTLFGVSETRSLHYDAKLDGKAKTSDDKDVNLLPIKRDFVSIASKREGWSASESRVRSIVEEINAKYGTVIFDKAALLDASRLRLFDIQVTVNLYDEGLERLRNLPKNQLEEIQRRYKAARAFRPECDTRRTRIPRPSSEIRCGNLSTIISQSESCKKTYKKADAKAHGRCLMKLAGSLEEHLEFKDFVALVGEKNYYLYGEINGFRKDSEILNDPILSHSMGEIAGRNWDGPLEAVKRLIGAQSGEFEGRWIRESL
jgi:hypothetical protein